MAPFRTVPLSEFYLDPHRPAVVNSFAHRVKLITAVLPCPPLRGEPGRIAKYPRFAQS